MNSLCVSIVPVRINRVININCTTGTRSEARDPLVIYIYVPIHSFILKLHKLIRYVWMDGVD